MTENIIFPQFAALHDVTNHYSKERLPATIYGRKSDVVMYRGLVVLSIKS